MRAACNDCAAGTALFPIVLQSSSYSAFLDVDIEVVSSELFTRALYPVAAVFAGISALFVVLMCVLGVFKKKTGVFLELTTYFAGFSAVSVFAATMCAFFILLAQKLTDPDGLTWQVVAAPLYVLIGLKCIVFFGASCDSNDERTRCMSGSFVCFGSSAALISLALLVTNLDSDSSFLFNWAFGFLPLYLVPPGIFMLIFCNLVMYGCGD